MIKNKLHTQEYVLDIAGGDAGTGAVSLSAKADASEIPAGAIVCDAMFKVLVPFVGGTDLAFGNLADQDGYVAPVVTGSLTQDAVHNAAGGTAALLWDDTNDHLTPVVPADGEVYALMTGTHTVGKAVLVVSYYLPKAE